MSTATLAGTTVDVDAEGFLTDTAQWNEQVAAAIAAENGIAELTDRHWQVVRFMRDTLPARRPGAEIRSSASLRRPDQGALPALPQGPREARRQDRRHPQAPRLHLGGPT